MKIAVFHNLPDGGAKIALFEQVKRLAHNHQLELFAFLADSGEHDISSYCKKIHLFPYQVVESTRRSGKGRILEDIKSFTLLRKIHKQIASEIDNGGFDLVFVHQSRLTHAPYLLRYLNTKSAYYCQEPLRMVYEPHLRLERNVRLINTAYEKINRYIRKKIDLKNAASASAILVSSKYIQAYVKKVYKKDAELCPLAVDTDVFKQSAKNRRSGILYVGKKNQTDGYLLLKEALALLPGKLCPKLTVIEPKKGELKYSTLEMVNYYSTAEATVCPAILEPFGLTALESMACSTPVIAVSEGGYKETVIDGKTGFLVTRDHRELAEKIRLATTEKKMFEKMGENARNHVLNNWSWDHNIKILENKLKEIA